MLYIIFNANLQRTHKSTTVFGSLFRLDLCHSHIPKFRYTGNLRKNKLKTQPNTNPYVKYRFFLQSNLCTDCVISWITDEVLKLICTIYLYICVSIWVCVCKAHSYGDHCWLILWPSGQSPHRQQCAQLLNENKPANLSAHTHTLKVISSTFFPVEILICDSKLCFTISFF